MSYETVFVFGAGLSKSFNAKFPITDELLKRADEQGIFDTSESGGPDLQLLKGYILDYFHNDLSKANFEKVATFLTNTPIPLEGESPDVYPRLFMALIAVITGMTGDRNLIPNRDNDWVNDRLSLFADYIVKKKYSLISFNYDLILDNFLLETKVWFPTTGYGKVMTFPPQVTENPRINRFLENRLYGESPMTLLKLHGSLNWGTQYSPVQEGSGPIYLNSNIEVKEFAGRPVAHWKYLEPFRVITTADIFTKYHYIPYIVPPVFGKRLESELILATWFQATNKLTAAKRIIIIGYSFPESDIIAERMFRESQRKPPFLSNGEPKEVVIVNKAFPTEKGKIVYEQRIRDIFFSSDVKFVESDAIEYLDASFLKPHYSSDKSQPE